MSFDIKSWKNQVLDYLKEKLKNNQYNEIVDIVGEYKDLASDIHGILECAYRSATTKEQKKEIWKLYEKFSYDNIRDMVEKLYNLGYDLRKNEELRESFSKQAYRIMEKTRYGQRSEVYYLITRIFTANKKEFPRPLIKAFYPIWSDELFKTFIYSFLNGILGETKEGGEE